MKTKFLFSILLCLAMAYGVNAQISCNNPPNCVQNGDLVGPTTSGDMNSTPALTVPDWWVSNGSPTYNPSNVWMWSYGNTGEGIFTYFNFIPNHTYRVCLMAQFAGSNTNGTLELAATTGLAQDNFSTAEPVPSTSQSIASDNITVASWQPYSYVFTANASYCQLWVRPLELSNDHATQYAIFVDNIYIEDLTLPLPVLSITPSGPFVNGTPVNLTASGAPTGATYNWSPSGSTSNPITVTPTCQDQIISVTANYNSCPQSGTVTQCQRTTAPATIDIKATQGCCGSITTSVYCNGLNAMMDFWITNTGSFPVNGYRLHILPAGTIVAWNNAISIPVGLTGGPYTINLSALGLSPGQNVCFYLDLLDYEADPCPKASCKTDQFCVIVPQNCNMEQCCNAWGLIAYDDYSNPQAPVSKITTCGSKIPLNCGTANGFDYNYTCKEGCTPSFQAQLYDPTGMLVYTNSSTGSATWYHIGGLPLTMGGTYTLRVLVYCGNKLCEECDLYLDVNCGDLQTGRIMAPSTPILHSVIPNPASNMTTIVSRNGSGPITSYALQTRDGVTLLKGAGFNKNEVTIDISSLPNGLYTLLINGTYTYKLIKQE